MRRFAMLFLLLMPGRAGATQCLDGIAQALPNDSHEGDGEDDDAMVCSAWSEREALPPGIRCSKPSPNPDPSLALRHFERRLSAHPCVAWYLQVVAWLHLRVGERADALQAFRRLAALKPPGQVAPDLAQSIEEWIAAAAIQRDELEQALSALHLRAEPAAAGDAARLGAKLTVSQTQPPEQQPATWQGDALKQRLTSGEPLMLEPGEYAFELDLPNCEPRRRTQTLQAGAAEFTLDPLRPCQAKSADWSLLLRADVAAHTEFGGAFVAGASYRPHPSWAADLAGLAAPHNFGGFGGINWYAVPLGDFRLGLQLGALLLAPYQGRSVVSVGVQGALTTELAHEKLRWFAAAGAQYYPVVLDRYSPALLLFSAGCRLGIL